MQNKGWIQKNKNKEQMEIRNIYVTCPSFDISLLLQVTFQQVGKSYKMTIQVILTEEERSHYCEHQKLSLCQEVSINHKQQYAVRFWWKFQLLTIDITVQPSLFCKSRFAPALMNSSTTSLWLASAACKRHEQCT